VPLALVAVTVNVYAVPFVRPVIVMGEEDELPVIPPGFEVAVYEVIADPPVAPAVNVTDASPDTPAVLAVPIVGACGTVVAVTPAEAADAVDIPYALVAVTVYVYCVDDCKPVTVTGDDVPVNVVGDVEGVGVTIKLLGYPALVFGVKATED